MNSSNRITNSGFTYNASGDMTADGTLTFTWNAEERLTAAGGVTYTYDGDGWRVKKSNGIIHWRSLSGEILAETDLSGNNLREYIYFAGRRVARRDNNGTVYYFLQDHLGSTRIIASSSGSVVRDADYYPHGTEKLVSGTVDDPHKFAGMYLDSESGLYYTWFRMYSPSLGRWLAPDPIAGDVATPGSLNRYTYVRNNPINFVDPFGLEVQCTQVCSGVVTGGNGGGGCPPGGGTIVCYITPPATPTSAGESGSTTDRGPTGGGPGSGSGSGGGTAPTVGSVQQKQASPEIPLHCHPDFIKNAIKAWMAGGAISGRKAEAGFAIQGTRGNPSFGTIQQGSEVLPNGNVRLRMTISSDTIAVFHTHPLGMAGTPTMGVDNVVRNPATGQLVPNYVGSREGLFVTDPNAEKGHTKLRDNLDWTKPCPE